ncbi:MAG: metallophosphoesterase family protein [Woeseiaceae bacterium]
MSRHLAIGDIHGCITALRTLVDFVGLHADDTIVPLGDYVDRGPDSAAVIDFVIDLGTKHNVVPLRGNHEIMMLEAREKESWLAPWLGYGGRETLQSYASSDAEAGTFSDVPDAHFDFIENKLQDYYECETHFFVHANADPKIPLDKQKEPALFWQKYKDPAEHCSGKIMVCGHTAQITGVPASNANSICIDTWAYGEGWLTCLDVESGTIWQANESGETRVMAA